MKLLTGLLALSLVLGTASCAKQMSTAERRAAYCQDLASLRTSVEQLQMIDRNSTLDDLRTARVQVRENLKKVKDSAVALEDARIDNLVMAVNNLNMAIDQIPQTATIEDAVMSIRDEVAAVRVARDQVDMTASCPVSSNR